MVNAKYLLAAVAGIASAAPSIEERTHGKHVVHKFDDAPRLPIVTLTTTSEYKGLNYQGFFYVDAGIAGAYITGFKPASPPTVITSGDLPTLLAGSPHIDTNGTTTKYFDFESFNFACVVNTAAVGVLGVPQGCTVTVDGFDQTGKGVATQEFTYSPSGLRTEMAHAKLDGRFRGLTKVQFHTKSTLELLIANAMDNMAYTLYE